MLFGCTIVSARSSAIVSTIEPSGCFERGRIVDAVRMWIQRLGSYVQTTCKTFVQTIEPAKDALSMEEAVKLFSTAFEQTCALKVIDGFVVNCLTH